MSAVCALDPNTAAEFPPCVGNSEHHRTRCSAGLYPPFGGITSGYCERLSVLWRPTYGKRTGEGRTDSMSSFTPEQLESQGHHEERRKDYSCARWRVWFRSFRSRVGRRFRCRRVCRGKSPQCRTLRSPGVLLQDRRFGSRRLMGGCIPNGGELLFGVTIRPNVALAERQSQ